ncbi:MAG: ATP-binding cassette domain-containing protein [Succinivibrionaceae bacterium]|nr:ATP-binding cassette domain-containing protein [Succinivibrionaceae bacterium]
MALITMDGARLSFSDRPLLDGASFSLQSGERVCLVGRNGAGKSTLLKIFAGRMVPDSGSVVFQSNLKVSMLDQDPPRDSDQLVWMYVAGARPGLPELLEAYDAASAGARDAEISVLQSRIEDLDGFVFRQHAVNLLERLGLPANAPMRGLSGGQLRRIALARAVADRPHVLLLDEPTNHLDIHAVESLRSFLASFDGAAIFISHDRRFIDETATRIAELDRGRIYSYSGSYARYLQDRDLRREIEDKANRAFDKKLSQEEIWIRQGIKARRTRNEGRVRDLKRMRQERLNRRSRQGRVSMAISQAEQSGQIVFEGQDVSYSAGGRCLFRELEFCIRRGDKVALSGGNGCGKTTLLKLLLGEIRPDTGWIRQGSALSVAYFDQYRQSLDENATVLDNLTSGRTEVTVAGHKKSVMGYLQDFLFEPRRAYAPVSALSGGEKNRLLLARLFLKEFNVLVMDEPTNDLDIETLELLEELLVSYKGTLILVSHDRWFLDNVATEVWHFGEAGRIDQVIGGWSDLERYLAAKEARGQTEKTPAVEKPVAEKPTTREATKLTYRQEQELAKLPDEISQLEERLEKVQQELADPEFYSRPQPEIRKKSAEAADLESRIAACYSRWEELEELKNSFLEMKKKSR